MPAEAFERRAVYQERKKLGYCPRCGVKRKKRETHTYCEDCREFFRNYNSEISESINKKRRAEYDKRKRNSQCPRCGKNLGKKYKKTLCVKCLGKNIPAKKK